MVSPVVKWSMDNCAMEYSKSAQNADAEEDETAKTDVKLKKIKSADNSEYTIFQHEPVFDVQSNTPQTNYEDADIPLSTFVKYIENPPDLCLL
jgi:hypothetical protein